MLSFVIVVLLFANITQCSHFRGAIFMWEPMEENTIKITYRIAWRLTSGAFCNDSVIESGEMIGFDSMYCVSGCNEYCFGCYDYIGELLYRCTDFSPSNLQDWSAGIGEMTYSSNSSVFTFGFESCCWIDLNYGNSGYWSMRAMVNQTKRTDIGRINTSPTVDLPLLVRLQNGCNHTLVLPVSDIDSDIIRCRWAVGIECADVCSSFPGAILDEETCRINYVANDPHEGYYAVALQVEDFSSAFSNISLSSVPFQFLVYVYNTMEGCGSVPEYVFPTPANEECVSLNVGDDFGVTITARSSRRLESIGTTSAVGMRKSAEVFSTDGQWHYISSNITWTPSYEDGGKEHNLCFYVVDTLGLTSPVRCMKIPVSVKGPTPLRVERVGVSNTWIIVLDQLFEQPKEPAFIRVFQTLINKELLSVDVSSSKDVVYNSNARQINVTFHYDFNVDEKYHVIIPSGLVQGFVNCHSVSVAINDSTFWKVEIDCGSLNLVNGKESAPNGTSYPSTVHYKCDPGYDLVGDDTRTCLVNRTWTGIEPQCFPKDCGSYSTPHFGGAISHPIGSTLYSTTVRFYCNIGYTVIGVVSMVCDVDGNWSNIPPSCIITDCGSLSAPDHGTIEVTSTVYGALVQYNCKTGYKLHGDSIRHCQASGRWNGSEPTCDIIDCGPLNAPVNGKIYISKTTYGSIVRFECDDGYAMVGDDRGECKEDGWNIDTPKCQAEEDDHIDDCYKEHGMCTTYIYENHRLLALKSSGCRQFCQCAHASIHGDGSVKYYWQKHDCPPGTLFDDSLLVPACVLAFMTQCPVGANTFRNAITTTRKPLDAITENKEYDDGHSDQCKNEHGVCNWITYHENRLLPLKSSGCQKFCLCAHAPVSRDGSQVFNWVDLKCPPGTLFDESLEPPACNHANSVPC